MTKLPPNVDEDNDVVVAATSARHQIRRDTNLSKISIVVSRHSDVDKILLDESNLDLLDQTGNSNCSTLLLFLTRALRENV